MQVRIESQGAQVPPAFVAMVTDIFMANQSPNSSVALRWSHSTSPASDDPDPVDPSSFTAKPGTDVKT